MTVTVVNKRKVSDHIYCGRGSALGNPYVMGHGVSRNKACDLYDSWFYKHVDEINFLDYIGDYDVVLNPQMVMLRGIFEQAQKGDINLGCFCAPKRCHCDTIKHFIDNKLEELEK